MAGFCTSAMQASTISRRLCGGILLAMPTAMPSLPLTSRLGMRVGQNFGLVFAFVVVGLEVDGFFVDVFEQRGGDAGEARFGVPHGRGRIAVDGTEVALAVDQRVAHRERLSHADQGVVDRGVAVRVQLTHDVADYAGGLLGGPVMVQAHFLHHKKDAAVHRLEAVADIGEGAADDHAHGVIEVGAAHLVFDVYGDVALVVAAIAAEGNLTTRRARGRGWRRRGGVLRICQSVLLRGMRRGPLNLYFSMR